MFETELNWAYVDTNIQLIGRKKNRIDEFSSFVVSDGMIQLNIFCASYNNSVHDFAMSVYCVHI